MSYILSIYLSRTIIGLGCFLIYEIVKKWYLLIDLCLHVFQKCPQNLMNVKKWQISEPDEIFYMIVCQLFNVYLQKIIIHKYFHFMGSYYLVQTCIKYLKLEIIHIILSYNIFSSRHRLKSIFKSNSLLNIDIKVMMTEVPTYWLFVIY